MQHSRKKLVISSSIPHTNMEALAPPTLGDSGWDVLYNPPVGTESDFWIVFSVVRDREWMRCAPENTLYLAGEPPSKKVHPRAFYSQFAQVVSLNQKDPHPKVKEECPCLNWHAGLNRLTQRYEYGYSELQGMPLPEKEKKLSVVCSNLKTTEGQRARLAFLDAIKERLGDRVVHFGRGFEPIDDKMEAIRPFACHLVLENERTPHYWSEKLADAYLGFAFPFYLGAPNVGDYFPKDSFAEVDPDQVEQVAEKILQVLEADPQDRMSAVLEARDLVLNRYNFFANAVRLADGYYLDRAVKTDLVIWSHRAFRKFPGNWIFRLKNRLRRAF